MPFRDRCAQAGVVKCVGFDTPADFNIGRGGKAGAYGQNHGIYPPFGTTDYTRAAMDTEVKASGKGSLRFTIPSNTGADSSGSWFTNFSTDLSTQFGEDSEFFVQWRQRFSLEFLTNKYNNGGGWKHVIIGTGDKPASALGMPRAVSATARSGWCRTTPARIRCKCTRRPTPGTTS